MSSEVRTANLEIEIKARVTDRAEFIAGLSGLGFRLLTPETLERNVLFDTAENSLRARREVLRIRKYGETWKLTHKAVDPSSAMSAHKVRIETELEIGDGQALTAIFERLGYQQVFIYEKLRTEWTDGHGHLVLDETPVGDFAELEGNHDWIDATAAKLGISPSEYLTVSYAKLFQDWKTSTNHRARNMTFEEIGSAKSRR